MTGAERESLRRLISETRRAQLEREARELAAVRTCTRCKCPVEAADLLKGRPWCKPCEAARQRRYWHAAREARRAIFTMARAA